MSDILLTIEYWAFLLIVLLTIACLKDFKYLKRISFGLLLLWVGIFGISPLPYHLAERLENKYTTIDPSQVFDITMVVVLGSRKSSDPDLSLVDQLFTTQLYRLMEGYRVYQMTENAQMVFSGSKGESEISQAETVANAALWLGIPAADTILLPHTYDTESEAIHLRNRFPHLKKIVLVTSALHMKRAVYWFEVMGFQVVPAPTDHQVKVDPDSPPSFWGWDTSKITLMNKLLHEYVGYLEAKYKSNKYE